MLAQVLSQRGVVEPRLLLVTDGALKGLGGDHFMTMATMIGQATTLQPCPNNMVLCCCFAGEGATTNDALVAEGELCQDASYTMFPPSLNR